ncbi:hypothetical protein [Nisaea sp.]|uniref:hypothetical protein n=1 Tax=Nisaea sp. TaxID=2024842 RepID=UPI003B5276F2
MSFLTKSIPLSACALLAAGCAATPDAIINYPLATSDGTVTVTRNVSCTVRNELIVQTTVAANMIHYADPVDRGSVRLGDLDGAFSNTSLDFEMHPDGRLKGVNTSSTGQGQTVLNAALKLAGTVLPLAGVAGVMPLAEIEAPDASPEERTRLALAKKICDYINDGEMKDGKPVRSKSVSLTFDATMNGDRVALDSMLAFRPRPSSEFAWKELQPALGNISGRVTVRQSDFVPVTLGPDIAAGAYLKMREPAMADIEINMGPGVLVSEDWTGTVMLAQFGPEYEIPIPKSALFGKQTFELAVSEAGRVTKIGYGKDTGAAEALGVAQTAVDMFKDESAASEAKKLNDEADVIKAQQRLTKCQADPATCE